jgi:hypothetical protein
VGERKSAPIEAVEAAMALLQEAPDQRLNVVLLNKAMFYLDLVALRDLGRTVSGCAYLGLKNGPVVAKYDTRLLRTLEDEGVARWLDDGMAKPVVVVSPLVTFKVLSEPQRALVPSIVKGISKMSSTAASDFSHANPGWQLAYRDGLERGRPAQPINMLIAMQQLADRDPWLAEDLDPQTLQIAAGARSASRTF